MGWKEKLTDLTEKGAMKDAGVKIEAVSLSKRLTDSPVVVVTSQFGYSAQQEKIMKAQAFQNKDQISMMSGRKTLEINPNHPVVVDLLSKVKDDKEHSAALDTAQVLFQTALIESGTRLQIRLLLCHEFTASCPRSSVLTLMLLRRRLKSQRRMRRKRPRRRRQRRKRMQKKMTRQRRRSSKSCVRPRVGCCAPCAVSV